MNDSSKDTLPVASETTGEMEALENQDPDAPVPLRKEAATAGLLPTDRAEDTDEDEIES
jgi:hypothetical protein